MKDAVFVGVIEKTKTGTVFVKELGSGLVNIVGKIDAVRDGGFVKIAPPNGIGINLEINGTAKRFINGDQVDRLYRVFLIEQDALDWIYANKAP